jgi:hypothetical protein
MKKYSSDCSSRICFNKTVLVIGLICFSVAFSCTSALYIPSENHVTYTADLAGLQAGRKLYISKCSSCHTLYLPEKYSNQDWHRWVDKMAPRAKIDTLERRQILNYVLKGN